MAPNEGSDLKKCITQKAPTNITERCSLCGLPYPTSVRAIAEGRDVCTRCTLPTEPCPLTSVMTIRSPLFVAYYAFFESFWKWINNRKEEYERAVAKASGDVLFALGKEAECQAELVTVEEKEYNALSNLFHAYVLWKVHPNHPNDERTWKRLFYAFWYAENALKE